MRLWVRGAAGKNDRTGRPARVLGWLVCALAVALVGPLAEAQAGTATFSYTGGEQLFTVPEGVTQLEVVAIGGHGGGPSRNAAAAEVIGTVGVTPGETLYVEVGGVGGASGTVEGAVPGGFNGGGEGYGSGGGATDLRTQPMSAGLSPEDRLLVAGGGGGQGGNTAGGAAGGSSGERGERANDSTPGGGGTSTEGGSGGSSFLTKCGEHENGEAGALGSGGSAGYCFYRGGGGGGGYYGGGGGGGGPFENGTKGQGAGGGGGGSSLTPAEGIERPALSVTAPSLTIAYGGPAVVTETATSLTQTTATVTGTVNPEGEEVTECEFQYGQSTRLGKSAPCTALPGSGTSPVEVSASLSGLTRNFTYYYRVVATNAAATRAGQIKSFKTLPNAPTVTTNAPSRVKATFAVLRGTVFSEASPWSCAFEYGTTPLLGTTVPCSSGYQGTQGLELKGIEPNTTYYYRLVATNAGGTSQGEVKEFITQFLEPTPNFGRCILEASGSSEWGTPGCTSKGLKANYEWYGAVNRPKPMVKPTFGLGVSGEPRFETATKVALICKGGKGAGEYNGAQTIGSVSLTLTGCHLGTAQCSSGGAAEGEVKLEPLAGELGTITTSSEGPAKNKDGLVLRPASGEALLEATCGVKSVRVRGSAIVPEKTGAMANIETLIFAQAKGVQKPLNFEGGAKDSTEMSVEGAAYQQAGLALKVIQQDAEKVEVNPVT